MHIDLRHILQSLFLVIFLVLMASCNGAQGVESRTIVQRQVVNDMTITLETAETLVVNQQAVFVVTVTDGQGKPVPADVYLDLVMPAHPMGTNQPLAEPSADGVYRTSSVFTMDGEWAVTVVATAQGRTNQAIFHVMVLP